MRTSARASSTGSWTLPTAAMAEGIGRAVAQLGYRRYVVSAGDVGSDVAEALAVAALEPITQRMNDFLADPAEIDRILGQGAIRADEIATPILERTKQIMGLLRTRP